MQPFCLRRVLLSPRLFQQTCRLASTKRRSVRAAREHVSAPLLAPKSAQKDHDLNDSIRWFEKDVETGEMRRVTGNPDELEAEELRLKIKALENELDEYRADLSSGTLLAGLDPEDKAKVKRAMEVQKAKEQDIVQGLEISTELPPLSVPLLKRLNASLKEAALHPFDVARRKDLWRWYSRGKHNIPALPQMLPRRAWDVLWETQSVDSPTNPGRLVHMEQLLNDMQSADQYLSRTQAIALIDTLVALNKPDQALQAWEEQFRRTGGQDTAILDRGIRLLSSLGHMERANTLYRDHAEQIPNGNSTILISLIGGNAKAGNDEIAFSLYLLLQSKLGTLTMRDYDGVTLAFLEANKKDLALAVFRDMMMQGGNALESSEGLALETQRKELYKTLQHRANRLRDRSHNVDDIHGISLTALSVIPARWQNKFFYASWLKKLIGMFELEAATKVVELMYERGIEPDARHINGLAGAFLRSSDSELIETGEKMLWAMLQQRTEFAWRRRAVSRGEDVDRIPSSYKTEEGLEIPIYVGRPMPRGTMETINVLAAHYSVSQKWPYVQHLYEMLRRAELHMDTVFMNHYLYMRLYHHEHGQRAAWRAFVRHARLTSPDLETYTCLWTGELQNVTTLKPADREGFPDPRELFSVMVTWISSMHPKLREKLKEEFSLELYAKIVQSFCTAGDFSGCLVAVNALAELLGRFPTQEIVRIITTSISNMDVQRVPTMRARRGRQQLPGSESKLQSATKLLSAIVKRRKGRPGSKDSVDPVEGMDILSELIRTILLRFAGDADTVENAIVQAAREMAVPNIRLGDSDAFNVKGRT